MQESTTSTTTPTPTPTATTATISSSVVTMTTTKFKDVILETIDQLRQRKARPDLERISHMLQRKHGISFGETEAILGKLVESQVVFKVDYKGSTSYRNAAKWRINHLASSGGGGGAGGGGGTGLLTPNSDQVSQKIREAVRALAGGGGNSSTPNSSSNNNSNNNISNSNSSSSSISSGGGGGGGGRRGRQQQQQQQQNNENSNISGAPTSSVTGAPSNKKSNSASTPGNTFNHAGGREPSTVGTTTKKGSVRADKASTNFRATSSEDKNNNSKSPAGGSVAPAAITAATTPTASSSTTASQASSSRRTGGKKEGPVGVNLKDLENWLTKQDSDNPLVKNLLVTALQREVQSGWLKRLRNGNYIDVASTNKNNNTKKKSTNNNKGNKNTAGSGGASTPSPALTPTPVTSPPPSVNSCAIVSPPDELSIGKPHPTINATTPNTNNNNNIIIITNSANSSTNSGATLITSSPPNGSFAPQPAKPNNISHGTKRSASTANSTPFLTATSQPLISPSTSGIIPTSDLAAHNQQSTTLVLVPSSTTTTSVAAHPALLLPVSPAQPSTDSDRRTAPPLTISSASASSFSSSSPLSSSSSSSSISASSGSNHNNNALARESLSSTLSTPSMSTGTPGLSREPALARRDSNNAKTAKSAAADPTNAPVPAKRGRPASKRKRFKKTPGPEFETEDILKSEPEKCVNCSLTAQANKHGQLEDLLVCKDCNTTVHPSCMDYSEELALRARNSPWQCIECKTCYVCDDSGDGDCMLFCDACDKGYHMKCHVPHVEQKPKGKWVCGQCVSENGNSLEQPMEFETSNSGESRASSPSATGICRDQMEASGPSCLPTPCDSPVQPDLEEKEIGRENESISLPMLRDFQGPYPDAANWTIDDVVNFFKSAGFVSQAEAFREQEIDGKSLLLMKRSDVLTGLSLKLGPALKMYTHVQNLQLVGQSSFVNGTGH